MENTNQAEHLCDERISKPIHDTTECVLMSMRDKEEFIEVIKKAGSIDLYLAGHTHAYSEFIKAKDNRDNDDNNVQRILVADKLYDEDRSGVHGYVIEHMTKQSDGKTGTVFWYKRGSKLS